MHVVEPFVVALLGYQLFVCAALHDFSFVQHAYLVGMLDGAQAVGNGDGGSRGHQSFQCVLHQSLALGVQRRGGLVENQNGRILQDGACDADALALTSRQAAAAVAHVRVVSVFHLHDELVGVGNAGGLLDFLLCGAVLSKGNVVAYGVVKQDSLLVDVADEASQRSD